MIRYQYPKTSKDIHGIFGQTVKGTERYVIFTAREYGLRNKKDLDFATQERKTLCAIGLYLPGGLAESLSQDWGMTTPLSLQAGFQNLAGWVSGKAGEMINGLIKTYTGQVLAPAQELVYNGPGSRTINFNYDFTPISQEEADEVKLIITAFKRWSSPSSKYGRLLTVPPIWEIKMSGIDSSETNEFLTWGFKDRYWGLTGIDFNYSPDGNFSAFHSGFPTKITMALNFAELLPMWRKVDDNNELNEHEEAVLPGII